MMQRQPLIPEDRAYAEEIASRESNGFDGVIIIRRLLAAEQFWRGVVKTADPFVEHQEHGGSWKECRFCGGGWGPQHKPDCSWLLAQEDL